MNAMSFWERIKQAGRSFMAGRHGVDQLSMALLWVGVILSLLGSFLNVGIVGTIGLVGYCFSLFRIFSRNNEKRAAENRRYLNATGNITRQWKQAHTRFKKRKEYKYFKCPGCKGWLRLPRGAGVVTVTCSRCKNNFTEKA